MSRFDDAVSEVMSSAPAAPGVHALRRRTRRRRYTRAAVALGLLAASAVAAVVADASNGGQARRPSVQVAPPTAAQSTVKTTSVPTSSAPPVTAPATTVPVAHVCTATELQLSLARDLGSLMQQPAAFFALTNRSHASCTVAGYPTLSLYDAADRPISLVIRHGGAYQLNDPGPLTATVQPGDSAYFGFGWVDVNVPDGNTNGCVSITRVRVLLPNIKVSLKAAARLSSLVCPSSGSVTAIAPRARFTVGMP